MSNDALIRVRCAAIAIAIIAEVALSPRIENSSDGRREARPGERGAPRCNTFIMISCHYLKYKVEEGKRVREIEMKDEAGARRRKRMREAGRDQEK